MFDQQIITRFKLFTGRREKSVDEKILDMIREGTEWEIVRFVEENTNDILAEEDLEKVLESIPFWRLRLKRRITHYLIKLKLKAEEIHGKRGNA